MTTVMINTHILTPEFELYQADSVAEAVALLDQHRGEIKVLAGGTDLLINMKLERILPPKVVLNIGRLKALKEIKFQEDGLTLGALTTFYDLQRSKVIREKYRALNEAAHSISGTQIKVMGTLGGNLCNASPAADSAPPLLIFDARIKLVSKRGERQLALAEFFTGPGLTTIEPDELLTEIFLPAPHRTEGSAFLKIGRVGADIAKVSAAARLVRDGDTVADCRIALGSVAPTPVRASQAESYLSGKKFSPTLAEEASDMAVQAIKPITDVRSTAWYRLQTARVLVRDALLAAWNRA